jgi:hypothetical protein
MLAVAFYVTLMWQKLRAIEDVVLLASKTRTKPQRNVRTGVLKIGQGNEFSPNISRGMKVISDT